MEHQVRLVKGLHGWKATTDIPLEAPRVLRIETSKLEVRGVAAGVSTTASVHKVDGHFITMDLFGDFRKTVARDSISKCTEKSVKTLHAKALVEADAYVAEAVAFYVAKDAAKVALPA